MKTKKKRRSSSRKFNKIRCESKKITKKQFLLANSSAVAANLGVLGLDLYSSSPEHVNFFGAQSSFRGAQFSFGGHKQSFGGAWPQNSPKVAPGLSRYRQTSLIAIPSLYFSANRHSWAHNEQPFSHSFQTMYVTTMAKPLDDLDVKRVWLAGRWRHVLSISSRQELNVCEKSCKSSFCDITKLRNAGLPIARSQTD